MMKTHQHLIICAAPFVLLGSLQAATVPGSTGQSGASDAPPLRVVTTGHSSVARLRESLESQVALCRKAQHLPPEPKGIPSDAALAGIASIETESLYDGPRFAQYEIVRNVMPDSDDGCKVKVLQFYSVTIETSCASQWNGTAGARDFDIEPLQVSSRERPKSAALAKYASCKVRADIEPRLQAALKATSRHDAGLGQKCLWSNEVDLHLAGTGTPGAVSEDRLSGMCDLAELPFYPYTTFEGGRRSVTLQMRLPPSGAAKLKTFAINDGINQPKLKEFSLGTPIPAGRFTPAEAQAFLKRPALVTLTEPAK